MIFNIFFFENKIYIFKKFRRIIIFNFIVKLQILYKKVNE